MTSSESMVGSYFSGGMDVQTERLRVQLELTWAKEEKLLRRIGVREDMSILELGSGPGFVTRKLIGMVPEGKVTGIEFDPLLNTRAQAYLQDIAPERYRIVQGDVLQMDLPTDTFDVVLARYLLSHVPDPLVVLREALRVLRPGGIFVTVDFDVSTAGRCEPNFPELQKMRQATEKLLQIRGTKLRMGRREHRRALTAAGFRDVEVASVSVDSDEVGDFTPFIVSAFDPNILGQTLVDTGIWASEDLDAYRAGIQRFLASEDPFILQSRPVAWGRKP